jgi:hypothetical protein
MPAKRELIDALSVRFARKKSKRNAKLRVQTKRTMTLLLGAALSVGGVTEALEGAHFIVEKDLDQVRVVKRAGGEEKVVAELSDSFTGNSIYKLAKVAPKALVSYESSLFESAWLSPNSEHDLWTVGTTTRKIGEKISLINDELREQFFKSDTIPYGELIHEKATKYDVDPALVAAIMEQESRFKHRAKSPVGARGLMQLMPRTGRWMGARDLYDPEQNVDAGAKYLAYLEKRFDGNLKKQIAAYNAGEGNVRRYNGVPPFRETRTYVKKVLKNYEKRNQQMKRFSSEQASEQRYAEGSALGASN